MLKTEIRNSACAAALLLFASAGAQACQTWRDEATGMWRGNCILTLDPKVAQIKQSFIEAHPQEIRFKMPDLTIRKYIFNLIGNSLDVYADVNNIGDQTASATNIGITVTTFDPGNPAMQVTTPMMAAVPSIAAMSTRRIYLGTVFVDYSMHDVNVTTGGMVDQVTVAQPVRGTVVESNETNNSLIHMCAVFGPAPVAVLPACN
jgi:hypothetical protein